MSEQIFYIQADTLEIVKELPEELGDCEYITIDHPDQMLEPLSKEQLIEIRTNVRGKEAKGDSKKSAKKLAFEIYGEVFKEKKPAKAKVQKEKKPTKMGMIRELLAQGPMEQGTLAEAIGSDGPNTHTMISILGNEKRTKDPLFVAYNKVTKVYTACEDAEECANLKAVIDAEIKEYYAAKKKAETVHSEGPEKDETKEDWKEDE